jgi:hypothetical protein
MPDDAILSSPSPLTSIEKALNSNRKTNWFQQNTLVKQKKKSKRKWCNGKRERGRKVERKKCKMIFDGMLRLFSLEWNLGF